MGSDQPNIYPMYTDNREVKNWSGIRGGLEGVNVGKGDIRNTFKNKYFLKINFKNCKISFSGAFEILFSGMLTYQFGSTKLL